MTRHPRNALLGAFAVTAVFGLLAKQLGADLPDTVVPIAIALIVGGFVIFAVEGWAAKQPPRSDVTWTVALAVGGAQVVAGVFPGTSRSAAAAKVPTCARNDGLEAQLSVLRSMRRSEIGASYTSTNATPASPAK